MAGSSAAANRSASVDPDEFLGPLEPITEDRILRTETASPTADADQIGYFDFAPKNSGGLRRSSTDPTLSPSSPRHSIPSPKARAQTTYESHAESSRNAGPPKAKSSFAHFALNWLRPNRQDTTGSAPSIHLNRRHSTHETNYSESFEATEVWDRKAILSLDGGGIRGYSALLILRSLMTAIALLEETHPFETENHPDGTTTQSGGPAPSSYHPLPPSPMLATDEAERRLSQIHRAHATKTSMYLPCHYFDYMAGTSTGGLISIMLGRLRMSIDDCIADYEKLGAKVFAHSRWCHLRSPLWLPREKYSHRVLQEVIEEVVDARVPKIGGFPGGKIFAFDENRCRVVVVSFQEQVNGKAEKPYLFRTYKNLHRSADPRVRFIDRNPGPAHDLPIWQVARATSAAPTYFKEVTIEKQKYLDGGFGANNPSVEIYAEVRRMNNNNNKCISAIISIGTGKNDDQRINSKRERIKEFFQAGLSKYINFLNFAKKWATNSENSHDEMTRHWVDSEKRFEYYRFNVEEGLGSMKLDEWKARGRLRVGTGRFLARMRPQPTPTNRTGIELTRVTDSGSSSENDTANGASNNKPPGAKLKHSVSVECAPDEPQPPIPPWFQPRNRTLEKISEHTTAYLARPEVQAWIDACAKILVRGRRERARADPQRWERACFGAWYQCNVGVCPRGEKEYPDRHALEKHLLDKHRTVYSKVDERSRKELDAAIEKCKVIVQ